MHCLECSSLNYALQEGKDGDLFILNNRTETSGHGISVILYHHGMEGSCTILEQNLEIFTENSYIIQRAFKAGKITNF